MARLCRDEKCSVEEAVTWLKRAVGVALVVVGVAVLLLAARQHRVVLRQLARGEPMLPPSWSLGVVIAVLLAIIGAAMVVYLSVVSR